MQVSIPDTFMPLLMKVLKVNEKIYEADVAGGSDDGEELFNLQQAIFIFTEGNFKVGEPFDLGGPAIKLDIDMVIERYVAQAGELTGVEKAQLALIQCLYEEGQELIVTKL